MSLEAYLETRDTIIERLAVLYQINASLISLKEISLASELRRKLESNGTAQKLRLTVTILVPAFQPPSSDGNDSIHRHRRSALARARTSCVPCRNDPTQPCVGWLHFYQCVLSCVWAT